MAMCRNLGMTTLRTAISRKAVFGSAIFGPQLFASAAFGLAVSASEILGMWNIVSSRPTNARHPWTAYDTDTSMRPRPLADVLSPARSCVLPTTR